MKNKLLISSVLLFSLSGVLAQSPGTQLGVSLIGPTGLGLKAWLNSHSAISGAMTGRVAKQGSGMYVHVDYLLHQFDKITVEGGKLPLYWGFGGKLDVADGVDAILGVRLPLGVSYIYGENLFDLFFEMVPFMDLAPDPVLSIGGAVGFRIFI
jgi:hypothetical protein